MNPVLIAAPIAMRSTNDREGGGPMLGVRELRGVRMTLRMVQGAG
jgi:hypothetical protein